MQALFLDLIYIYVYSFPVDVEIGKNWDFVLYRGKW
jgi:hypothetical protein